jgi:hypothetical protein
MTLRLDWIDRRIGVFVGRATNSEPRRRWRRGVEGIAGEDGEERESRGNKGRESATEHASPALSA